MNSLDKLKRGLTDSKGQSFVIQFIMFFMIGMGMFIMLGNFFKFESENIKNQLIDYSTEMIGSYVSSMVVSAVEGCQNCGVVEYDFRLAKTYTGHFIEIDLSDRGVSVISAPEASVYDSSLNNLNESIDITDSSVSSMKTINLTYNKNQNKLEIS
jgi:hypothetical protein